MVKVIKLKDLCAKCSKQKIYGLNCKMGTAALSIDTMVIRGNSFLLLLSLVPQLSLGLGILHKIRLNFLEASQFSFLQDRIVSPAPNPHPGGPNLCIYPRDEIHAAS
jgi:hypothetical protein